MEMIYRWSGDPCPPKVKTSEKEEETPKEYIKAEASLNGTHVICYQKIAEVHHL